MRLSEEGGDDDEEQEGVDKKEQDKRKWSHGAEVGYSTLNNTEPQADDCEVGVSLCKGDFDFYLNGSCVFLSDRKEAWNYIR